MYSTVYTCGCTCVCVCTCNDVHVCVNSHPSLYLVTCYSITDPFVRFGPVTGDSDLCSLCTRYTGYLKIIPWDDPEIPTGSCSEDQTAIQIQNCVISCECLLLYYFLIYRCQCYIYATLYHFLWCRGVLTLFVQLIWAFIIIISCVEDYHFWS